MRVLARPLRIKIYLCFPSDEPHPYHSQDILGHHQGEIPSLLDAFLLMTQGQGEAPNRPWRLPPLQPHTPPPIVCVKCRLRASHTHDL